MATHIELLAEAIKTIGRSLPQGMEVHYWHAPGEQHTHMEIVSPDGGSTEYAFTNSRPLPLFPLAALVRESKLERSLRDLLDGIERHVDLENRWPNDASLKSYIESAERLLCEDWAVDETHPANKVTSAPASISYPVGSLGEPVEVPA